MKRLFTVIIIALSAMAVCGSPFGSNQKLQRKDYPSFLHEIKGVIVEEHDSVWYHAQFEGWLEQTRLDPKDEYAWLNCYRAKRYELLFSSNYDETELAEIRTEMKKHIPDTYVYYICAMEEPDVTQEQRLEYLTKAFELIPTEKVLFDYDKWFYFLKAFGDNEQFSKLAKEYYDSGLYSNELIQCSLNELNCMEEGGIFIGNGDATVGPKWLIQEGMGKHRDKLVICQNFILIHEYCERIYDELGIGDVPEIIDFEQDPFYYTQIIIDDIAVKTGRTLYFSKFNPADYYQLWEERGTMYDIGLLLQDSPDKELDIYLEQKRFFDSTDFTYLDNPIKDDAWVSDSRCSYSLTSCFWQLMIKYKQEGDTANYQKIYEMMEKAVKRIPDESRRSYGQMVLDEYATMEE